MKECKHEWHYNEATKITWTTGIEDWSVVRFCVLCRVLEDIVLRKE